MLLTVHFETNWTFSYCLICHFSQQKSSIIAYKRLDSGQTKWYKRFDQFLNVVLSRTEAAEAETRTYDHPDHGEISMRNLVRFSNPGDRKGTRT